MTKESAYPTIEFKIVNRLKSAGGAPFSIIKICETYIEEIAQVDNHAVAEDICKGLSALADFE